MKTSLDLGDSYDNISIGTCWNLLFHFLYQRICVKPNFVGFWSVDLNDNGFIFTWINFFEITNIFQFNQKLNVSINNIVPIPVICSLLYWLNQFWFKQGVNIPRYVNIQYCARYIFQYIRIDFCFLSLYPLFLLNSVSLRYLLSFFYCFINLAFNVFAANTCKYHVHNRFWFKRLYLWLLFFILNQLFQLLISYLFDLILVKTS